MITATRSADTDFHYAAALTGMSDGFIIPLALTTAMSLLGSSPVHIAWAGLTAALTGGIAMGLSGYYTDRESSHSDTTSAHDPFTAMGLDASTRELIREEMAKDAAKWEAVPGSSTEASGSGNAWRTGVYTGLAYTGAGILTGSPYLLLPAGALTWSLIITFAGLALTGCLRAHFTGRPLWSSVLRPLTMGILAAGAAMLIAQLFV